MATDPYANQHAIYDAMHDNINDHFQEDDIDWPQLIALIKSSLEDPHLPRMYRTKYLAIASLTGTMEEPKLHLKSAKEGIENMRRVLIAEGRDDQYIQERLAAIVKMVESAEVDLTEDLEEDDGEAEATEEGHNGESAGDRQTERSR